MNYWLLFSKPLAKVAVPHETLLSGGSLRSGVCTGRAAKALLISVDKSLGSFYFILNLSLVLIFEAGFCCIVQKGLKTLLPQLLKRLMITGVNYSAAVLMNSEFILLPEETS